jgi:hypothetical protein
MSGAFTGVQVLFWAEENSRIARYGFLFFKQKKTQTSEGVTFTILHT